jgi:hypothetical protein
MSLFRRKLESKKTPGESSGAQASSRPGKEAGSAEDEFSSPSGEQTAAAEQAASRGSSEKHGAAASEPVSLRRELHRGSITAPAEEACVGGAIEIEASLAEGASNTGARLEWSQDEREWNSIELSGEDYELLAARAGGTSSRISIVRSIELAEAKKLSLEQEGYERVDLSPARPSSWQGGQRFHAGVDTAALPEGSCFLRLVTVSAEGEKVASDAVPVLVDNVAPTVRLHDELREKALNGVVALAVDAEDSVSGVSVVELEISAGGESWRSLAEAHRQPFSLRWNTEDIADGTYRLRVIARDGYGNLGLGEPVEIKIANTPAAAELVDPGELLRGRVNLIARTPDLRSTQMIFELAEEGSSDWHALGTTRAPFHLSVDTEQFADGSYELRIESITAEGQSVHSRRFGPYVIDNTPPVIKIVKPIEGETLQGRAELLVEVADDVSGPAQVELSFSQGEEWEILAELEPDEGEVRGLWLTSECRPGECRLRVKASDRAGNEAEEAIDLTIAAPTSVEPVAEPESTSPIDAQEQTVSIHRTAATGRFGEVPSWDWKRRRPPAADTSSTADTTTAQSDSAEKAGAPERVAGPSPVGSAEIRPSGVAQAKNQAKTGIAWTWKALPPPSKVGEEEKSEQENESGEQAADAEKESARELSVVEEVPDEKREKVEEVESKGPTDTGAHESGRVVNVDFARAAGGWDLWALGALVEDTPGQDPVRLEERRQILYHLREHSSVDGHIPPGFEALIYEVFGELIPGDSSA